MSVHHKIAVIILNWNGSEMLRRFLPNVLEHTHGEGITVYVADNGSTDESRQMLTEEFPGVVQIVLDRNYGFAEGYNRAIGQVNAEYVLLLNSDVEVTSRWIEPLLTYMEQHPEVAACQPKIRSWKHKAYFEHAGAAGGFIDEYGYPFCRGRIVDKVEQDTGQYDTISSVFWASGAALLIRRADYLEAGGLDASFFAHMEEIDLCWRLRARGRLIVCVPQSTVYHVGGATLSVDNPRKTYLNFRNNLLMLYKNLPSEELCTVLCIRRCLDYLALLVFLIKGQWGNARSVWNARKDFKKTKPTLAQVRKENLQKTIQNNIPERYKKSILLQHYVRGKDRFNQLNFK